MLDFAPRPWAELVFHVLAHARPTASLAASVYDSRYVAFVRRHAGAAEARTLGEDAALLGRLLNDHGALARAQVLAWLFDTAEQARACADIDLSRLTADHTAAPELLPALSHAGDAAELLRCAALLEEPVLDCLPPVEVDEADVAGALGVVRRAAPMLPRCRVSFVRALRLRGRVLGRAIWVGAPSEELELTSAHVAWQAAHEATVREVLEQASERASDHDCRERVAVVMLRERASDAALGKEHAAWFAHLAEPRPPTDRGALDAVEAALVRACRATLG